MPANGQRWSRLALVNAVTLTRLVAGICAVPIYYSESSDPELLMLFSYIFASDLLDGHLARRLGVKSRAGAIFDYTVDRFNYYLAVSILIQVGLSPLLFLPYFLRDLIYISVQAYISLPRISGTKSASFLGTAAVYFYVAFLSHDKARSVVLEGVLFLALCVSLVNLIIRVARLRVELKAALKQDLAL